MTNESQKIPTWFWVIGIILLIWNLMGLASFFHHMTVTEETLQALPEKERALQLEILADYPLWAEIAYGLAVIAGSLAGILLLMKKKIAKQVFILSLIAVFVQMVHTLSYIPRGVEVYGPSMVVMPVLIVLLGAFAIWWAHFCTAKKWIK